MANTLGSVGNLFKKRGNPPSAGQLVWIDKQSLIPTFIVEEAFTVSADDHIDSDVQIPAGSRVIGYMLKCTAAGTITTGTSFGIGTGDDWDEIAELTFTSYDAVDDSVTAMLATPVSITTSKGFHIASTNGSGTKAGTLTTGSWVVGLICEKLPEYVDNS